MNATASLVKQTAYLETIVKIQHSLLECKDLSALYAPMLFDIRQATGASRSYFFRNAPLLDGKPMYSLVAESFSPLLSSRADLAYLTALPHANLPRWTTILTHNGLVSGVQSDFGSEERFFMSSQNIQSILLAPVMAGQRFLGFLGLDDCEAEREWSDMDKDLMRHLASALAHAILHLQTMQDLTRANQEKIELMEILAHDLKNPLSGILMVADVLLKKQDRLSREEIEKRLLSIRQCVERMRDISDQMLCGREFVPLESMMLRIEPIGVANLIETIAQSLHLQAAAKQLELVADASKEVPKALADRIAVLQILENLVSNAIKFSPPKKKIWIRLRQQGERVRIEVLDEGPGIKKEEHKLLFQKRAQLSARPTGGESSTGYGLWICKTLVDAMRGEIWCESEDGRGATFIVTLPIAPEQDGPLILPDSSAANY